MRRNKVKRNLTERRVVLGTMVFEFKTTGIARIAAEAGAEFVVFDMEHTGWSMEAVRGLMATSRSADLVPLVRVPATQYHFLARVLDAGALGLMVPMVESEEQARLIVDSAKYPPVGGRGAAFGIAHDDYTGGDIVAKMQSANEEQLIIAQIETAQGVANVESIGAVDGIDVLWIGHFDLTSSLGIPGQFDHPEFQASVDRVVSVATQYGKAAGFMASSVEETQALVKRGFRCLAYGGDLWIYQRALSRDLEAIREALGMDPRESR